MLQTMHMSWSKHQDTRYHTIFATACASRIASGECGMCCCGLNSNAAFSGCLCTHIMHIHIYTNTNTRTEANALPPSPSSLYHLPLSILAPAFVFTIPPLTLSRPIYHWVAVTGNIGLSMLDTYSLPAASNEVDRIVKNFPIFRASALAPLYIDMFTPVGNFDRFHAAT